AVYEFVLPVSEGKMARVGVSIGAASYPEYGETLDQVLIAADKAMYSVKATRKTRDITRVLPPLSDIINVEEYEPENFIVELDESHIVSSAIN
ncbi:MAG: diguanylate cyclase, partial [Actinomycetota bacterium]